MGIFNHKFLNLTFILSILLILSSCAPKSRTITPLTESNRSNIKKIAIVVKADEELDASVGEPEGLALAAIVSGLVVVTWPLFIGPWLIPYALLEHSLEQRNEAILESTLIQFHPDELMSDRLKHYLESSNAGFTAEIPEVKSPSLLKTKGFDAILEVNLKEWGIVYCPTPKKTKKTYWNLDPEEREILNQWSKYEPKVGKPGQLLFSEDTLHFTKEELEEIERLKPLAQKIQNDILGVESGESEDLKRGLVRTGIILFGRMILIEDNSTVWEREELYEDQNCYRLEDLKTQPELLVDILTKAIHSLAENTVNEIMFSRNTVE